MKYITLSLVCITALSAVNTAKVTAIKGNVYKGEDSKTLLHLGDTLGQKEQLHTTQKSKVQLKFDDGTLVGIGSDSEFKIDKYLLDNENSTMHLSATKGSFRFLTGKIGKLAPKRFALKTTTATMGIRGTDFAVSSSKNKTGVLYLGNGDGVTVSNLGYTQLLDDLGEGTWVNHAEEPGRIQKWKKESVTKLLSELDFSKNSSIPKAQTDFLNDAKFNAIWRSYYIANDKNTLANKEGLATGGELAYSSAKYFNTRLNLTLHTTHALYAPTNNVDGSNLSGGANDASINVFGIANVEVTQNNHTLTLGHQKLSNPMLNHKTVRMLPTTFSGSTLHSKVMGIDFDLGYITAIKQRYDDTFTSIGQHIFGNTAEKSPLLYLGVQYQSDNSKLQLWNYQASDFMNTIYTQGEYKFSNINLSVQYLKQTEASGFVQNIDSSLLGAKIDYKKSNYELSLAYNQSGETSDVITPWDGTPAFTDSMVSNALETSTKHKGITGVTDSAYVADTSSYKVALKLPSIGITKSALIGSYAAYTQKQSEKTRTEVDIVWVKKEIYHAIDLKMAYIHVENEKFGGTKTLPQHITRNQYRIILNYPF